MAKFEKQKYKIGTLVELSAAGAKADQNQSYVGGFGVVIDFIPHRKYPYTTKWMKAGETYPAGECAVHGGQVFKGYEIKKLKAVKK